jgi:hypothetical protein
VARIFEVAKGKPRAGDDDYAQARLIGAACEAIPGGLNVGVLPPPSESDIKEGFKDYSHGDCGVGVIDSGTGEVKWHAGYLAEMLKDGETDDGMAIPTKIEMGRF